MTFSLKYKHGFGIHIEGAPWAAMLCADGLIEFFPGAKGLIKSGRTFTVETQNKPFKGSRCAYLAKDWLARICIGGRAVQIVEELSDFLESKGFKQGERFYIGISGLTD